MSAQLPITSQHLHGAVLLLLLRDLRVLPAAAATTRSRKIWQPASFSLVLKNVIEHVVVDEGRMFCKYEHSCVLKKILL